MYDAIIVGSGFGGAMAAHRLVGAGWRVLMLERGPWVVRGPSCADPTSTVELTPYYSRREAHQTVTGGLSRDGGAIYCVGGPSVFFGGACVRLRSEDFDPGPEIIDGSGARWPFDYDDLEPYYGEAERIIGVCGDDSDDPTRPPRSTPYPAPPAPLATASIRVRDAARRLGLHPFPLPMAVNHAAAGGRRACTSCRTCDTYACAVEAKNDMAAAVVPRLIDRGLDLRPRTPATCLVLSEGRIVEVRAFDETRGETVGFVGRHVILAAGALETPRLLLGSGLQGINPAGNAVGRYLTRHCAAMVFGFCSCRPDPDRVCHKQLAVFDYYFGARPNDRIGRLGSIQQITTPPEALARAHAPWLPSSLHLGGLMEHLASLQVIAEDEPRASNRVDVDGTDLDRFGLPRLFVSHSFSPRDERRCRAMVQCAKRILRRVGAWAFFTLPLRTFSHALGTVRMGPDASQAPLDGDCRYRPVENLLVVDGSALPSSGAVNPSLTIAANALRAADRLVRLDAKGR